MADCNTLKSMDTREDDSMPYLSDYGVINVQNTVQVNDVHKVGFKRKRIISMRQAPTEISDDGHKRSVLDLNALKGSIQNSRMSPDTPS